MGTDDAKRRAKLRFDPNRTAFNIKIGSQKEQKLIQKSVDDNIQYSPK